MASKSQTLVFEVIAQADKAKRDLAELEKASKKAEEPVKVPVVLDGADAAEADLKAVGEAAEQAAKKVQDVGKGGGGDGLRQLRPAAQDADEGLKTLNRSADGTKNAFANLVGNSAQDISGLSGSFGSLGVAIGQVAEYTTDAANEGGGLKAALSGAASFAGPMLALAAASFAVQKVMGDIKKQSEEAKAANDAFGKSVLEGTGLIDDWGKALDDAFDAGNVDNLDDLTKFMKDTLKTTGDLEKTTTAFGQLGLTVEDLGGTFASADEDFRGWARALLESRGFTKDAAEEVVTLIAENEKLGDALDVVSTKHVKGIVPPGEAANLENYARGFSQVLDVVEKLDMEDKARQFNETARATGGFGDMIDKARGSGESELSIMLDVNDKLQEQRTLREEGAAAAKESGTIQEQIGRQLATATDLVTEAMKKAKDAQDDWLVQNVDYEGKVDSFTESLMGLTEQTKKQTEAGDEGAGMFEGNTKAALDNRDALRDVYTNAVDLVGGMKDAGFSVDGARTAQDNMAQSAYDLFVAMGYPVQKAQEIKDKINQIPPSVTTDVIISEQGAAEVEATKKRLQQDTESTHYIYGVLDRSVLNAINSLPAGSIPTSRAAVAPAAPSVGLQAVGAPVAAPQASPASTGTSSTVTVSQPIVVNVNAGIVADTFQLQRAVVRSARSFQRLAGKRAA